MVLLEENPMRPCMGTAQGNRCVMAVIKHKALVLISEYKGEEDQLTDETFISSVAHYGSSSVPRKGHIEGMIISKIFFRMPRTLYKDAHCSNAFYLKQTTAGAAGTVAATKRPDLAKAKEWHRGHVRRQGSNSSTQPQNSNWQW